MQTLIQISKAHRVFGLAALSLLTMTVLAVGAGAARAQSPSSSQYPSQQIRIIVPSLPGGATDIYARMLGKVAGEILGQTFVVENKPGAASQIGTDFVAKAKPDGYTLLMGSLPLSTNPGLFPRLPYDVLTDLRGVIHVSGQGFIVSVPVNSPYKGFAELVEVARQREVPYATPGAGTVGHLAGQVMNVRYGTRFVHVAYRGSAAAINDVTGGQVPVLIDAVTSSLPAISGGRLRAIAVTHANRAPALPTVPTMRELGFPEAEASAYAGIVMPAATPTDIVQKLNAAFNQAMQAPEVRQSFDKLNAPPIGGTADAFTQLIRREHDRWVPLIRALGIVGD